MTDANLPPNIQQRGREVTVNSEQSSSGTIVPQYFFAALVNTLFFFFPFLNTLKKGAPRPGSY